MTLYQQKLDTEYVVLYMNAGVDVLNCLYTIQYKSICIVYV
jgi:hypothetical protein